jgi:hypothetical protein
LEYKTIKFINNTNINSILEKYKYTIYLNNTCIISEKKHYITLGIELFSQNNSVKQIIFDHDKMQMQKFDFNDPYRKFEKIKYIITDKTNPFPLPKISQELDMIQYANHKPENFYHFKLCFSLIDNSCLFDNFPLFPFSLDEKLYSMKYEEKYYTTQNHSTNILKNTIKNDYIHEKDKNYDDVTIVTGFIDIKAGVKKKYYSYIDCSIPTLSIPQNMVIFVHKDIEQHVIDIRTKLGLLDKTKIINITLEDLYMYDKLETMKKNAEKNISPYNNPLYIMAVNSRYKYIEHCIDSNYFNTNYFAWVDFGISHVVAMTSDKLCYSIENKIRTAWIARLGKSKTEFTFNHCAMGGGLFMGHKSIMKKLCYIHDIEFRKLVDIGHSVNDDKLLYLIFEQYPEMFDFYFSSYDHMRIKF